MKVKTLVKNLDIWGSLVHHFVWAFIVLVATAVQIFRSQLVLSFSASCYIKTCSMGLRAKNSRSTSVQVHYLVCIMEIKPWPPSQSLRSLRSVLIQWENGDRNSGSTNPAVPSVGSVVGEGKIEFNESFKLNAFMFRDPSVKGGDAERFQKNVLELHLYEPRRDKTAKGQLLATASVDLADCGILKETISVTAPMYCKRSYGNTNQPLLFLRIQPIDKKRNESSLRSTFSKELSMESNVGESGSALINEEYAEEAEAASSTDDDVSSRSSRVVSPSFESSRNLHPQTRHEKLEENSSFLSSMDLSSDSILPTGLDTYSINHQIVNDKSGYTSSCTSSLDLPCDTNPTNGCVQLDGKWCTFNSYSSKKASSASVPPVVGRPACEKSGHQLINNEDNGKHEETDNSCREGGESNDANCSSSMNLNSWNDRPSDERSLAEDELLDSEIAKDEISIERYEIDDMPGSALKSEGLKHVKSVRSQTDSARSIGSSLKTLSGVVNVKSNEKKHGAIAPKDARMPILDRKIMQLEDKIKMLEAELREAAAIEAALYSVVAEHGSSMNKVHAPARRLSRLYLHAQKESLRTIRVGAARSAISGLVLVAKSCGNDVPRLSFWLSNAIMMRTIIYQTTENPELPVSVQPSLLKRDERKKSIDLPSSLKWKAASHRNRNTSISFGDLSNWDEHRTFVSALEKIEYWIFTRIVDSIWWQTMTPYMQPVHQKTGDNIRNPVTMKEYRRLSSYSNQEQEKFSLDLWKKAFRDAYERLCPVRAGGHECGCLPVLAKLVMEQCVYRLDVAMFNAILRESAEDIPTNPVSDPIGDSLVLPVPTGKISFGTGAQLKNAIGNWSIWLSNMFGLDDDDSLEETNDDDEIQNPSFKCFYLLNALSDLLMLPKDMLLSGSIRKEVCPNFGVLLIKRILDNFVLDEFCPDPIPKVVLEALDAEDHFDIEEMIFTNIPCTAAPIVYAPPSEASIVGLMGGNGGHSRLRKSGSSVICKSNTSDDELDELKSPLSSLFFVGSHSSTLSTKPSRKVNELRNGNAVRYDLLRELWKNSE